MTRSAAARGGAAVLGCAAALGCAAPPPERDCTVTIWAQAERGAPAVTGTFNDWSESGSSMTDYGEDHWYYLTLALEPGEYGYLVRDDDGTHVDPHNPQRTYHGETEVSLAIAPDCSRPEVTVSSVTSTDDGAITVTGTFLRGGDARASLSSVRAESKDGAALDVVEASPETGAIVLYGTGFPRGKHVITIDAVDEAGLHATAPLAVAWVKPAAPSWADGILYQVVVDRFRGDGEAALAAPETPGHRAGGTLDGVRAAIESGYFEKLGVSTLWLSPVYLNPTGMFEGRDGEMYQAYHGYWPVGSRAVEPQIGGEDALRALVSAAHARGMAVLLDFVPNHVHQENERYTEHAADGWFNDGPDTCVCGTSGCGWDERLLDCWFADYLPDVRWQAAGAMRATIEDASFWTRSFDVDGLRIDAVPMMPRLATRRMALDLHTSFAPREALFSIGEVFTGAGPEGTDAIRYFLGPDGIDGAFDFPLAWALRGAIAQGSAGFDEIEATLAYSEETLAGAGAVLGRMVGNHDMPRFVSEASGHASASAWSSPAPDPADALPYEKLTLALALVMTLPGLPVLYHGDEVGLAGGTDPDNRRVLPAESALSTSQRAVLETTRRLGRLRACSTALRRGSRKAFRVTDTTYGFSRVTADEAAIVMISTGSDPAQFVPPLKAVPAGTYVDAMTSEAFPIGEGAPVTVAPYSFRILLPENSPCLSE